ncbi:hypothetical protein NKI80_22280 [Mesorhizobium sp. M0387]|uniref:hypothetical protein n=1 Tax=Mesorhizobium sp. M0387 TaxID=2956940 RepID=UPI00333530DE
MKYPARFSAAAVDRIVGAVAAIAAAPDQLDRPQLGHELDRALFWRQAFEDVGGSQPWDARHRHGKTLSKAARSLAKAWTQESDAGRWWRNQIAPNSDLTQAIAGFEMLVDGVERHIPAKRLGVGKAKPSAVKEPVEGQPPGNRPVRSLLEQDTETTVGWLVREHLPPIFKRHFAMAPKIPQWQSTRKNGTVIYAEPSGAYLAFVLALFKEVGIEASAGTIQRYAKARRRKPGTQKPEK